MDSKTTNNAQGVRKGKYIMKRNNPLRTLNKQVKRGNVKLATAERAVKALNAQREIDMDFATIAERTRKASN